MKKNVIMVAMWIGVIVLCAADVRADPEGRPCIPEPTDEQIEYGDLITCAIEVTGDSDLFRFVGATNEIVRIIATEGNGNSLTPDVCLELRNPNLTPILQQCHEVSTVVETVLVDTGEYTIRIFEAGNDQTMNYSLVLERVLPTSPTSTPLEDGITLPGEMISPVGDIDFYVFEGRVGDLIQIGGTEGNGNSLTPDVCLDLRRPDGSSVRPVVCHEVSAGIEETLDQDGLYTVILSEAGNDQAMNANILYTCLSGACETTRRPVCDIDLNQPTYTAGDVVTADVLQIANPTGAAVDLRLWLTGPGFPPVPAGKAVIPAGFDQDFGPAPLFTVTPAFPPGIYGLGCRMMSTVTGETLELDLNFFEVQ